MADSFDLVVLGGGIVGLWTALRGREAGLRVAVVEVGPSSLPAQRDPRPALRFPERVNQGALQARHHVLTGNSAYWGGALARNPASSLTAMFGGVEAGGVMEGYGQVESQLGVSPGSLLPGIGGDPLWEVVVLPGRRRGLWSEFLDSTQGQDGVRIYDRAAIAGVETLPDGRLGAVHLRQEQGSQPTLTAPAFSLSMGVIDGLHFLQGFLPAPWETPGGSPLGAGLHDHWSLEVGRVRWRNGTALHSLFPPKFARGGIVGRRIPFGQGFYHLTADYDAMPPFDRVKRFLALRQQGAGRGVQAGAALSAVGRPWSMLRAGLHYLRHRELRVPDGTEISLTLDFESAADPRNRLVPSGNGLDLYWDVRSEDEARFQSLLAGSRDVLSRAFAQAGMTLEWDVPEEAPKALEYLTAKATDAFHLGGGLPEGVGLLPGGRGPGCPNLWINSTMAHRTPGLANPVLTLLARASRMVRELRRDRP